MLLILTSLPSSQVIITNYYFTSALIIACQLKVKCHKFIFGRTYGPLVAGRCVFKMFAKINITDIAWNRHASTSLEFDTVNL